MVSKVDEFKTVVLAFDDVDEVASIINALRYAGNDDLACEIEQEVYGECDGCDCEVEDQRKSRPAREWLAEFGADGDCDYSGSSMATLIFEVDTTALDAATVKMTAFADAAERAANAAERLDEALK